VVVVVVVVAMICPAMEKRVRRICP